jgi:hypothetical protein
MDAVNASLGMSTRTDRDRLGLFGRVGANVSRAEEGEDDTMLNFGAGLSWERRSSTQNRSTLSFSIDQGFRAETLTSVGLVVPGADTFATNAGWAVARQVSPRTALSTNLRYSYVRLESDEPIPGSQLVAGQPPFRDEFPPLPGPSDDSGFVVPDAEDRVLDILATEGLSATQTNSHSAFATFGATHQLSQYSSMGLDFGGGYQTVDSDPQDLREGAQGAFRFWAQRRVGKSTTLGSTYQVNRSLVLEPATTIHSLVASYGYQPTGKNISLTLSGGAGYYQAEAIASEVTPVVNTYFSIGLTQTTQLSASYRRQFSQALGFGRSLLIDYANLTLTQKFGDRVDLILLGGASFGSDPLIEGSRYDAVQGGGTLSWRPLDSLNVGTSLMVLAREQSDFGGESKSSFNLWSGFITYTARWR